MIGSGHLLRSVTGMTKILQLAVICFVSVVGIGPAMCQSADEPTADLLASQLRDQGYRCDKPKGAKHDAKQSKPNETVWILTCEHDTYRMTVIPDLAAKVEKLKQSSQ
jgi:hypothetical protein